MLWPFLPEKFCPLRPWMFRRDGYRSRSPSLRQSLPSQSNRSSHDDTYKCKRDDKAVEKTSRIKKVKTQVIHRTLSSTCQTLTSGESHKLPEVRVSRIATTHLFALSSSLSVENVSVSTYSQSVLLGPLEYRTNSWNWIRSTLLRTNDSSWWLGVTLWNNPLYCCEYWYVRSQ